MAIALVTRSRQCWNQSLPLLQNGMSSLLASAAWFSFFVWSIMLQHLSKLLRTTVFGACPPKPQATLRKTVTGKSRPASARKLDLPVSEAQSALITAMKRLRFGVPPSNASQAPIPPTEKAKSAAVMISFAEERQFDRDEESSEMLRNMDLLDQYLNKSISVGKLSRHVLGFRFVSEMKMCENDVEVRGKSLILSGPPGVGKTALTYLLGWTAYVNNCIVVPLRVPFGSPDFEAGRFLEALKLRNSQFLAEIMHYDEEKGEWTTLERFVDAALDFDDVAVSAYEAVLKTLASYTLRPVVYVCEEHNQYWACDYYKQAVWRDWVVGSGGPHGARTCVIYAGQANSRFEAHLEPHMYSWVIHLQQLPRESLESYLLMEDFPLHPELQDILSRNDEKKEEMLNLIQEATYGNYWHLWELCVGRKEWGQTGFNSFSLGNWLFTRHGRFYGNLEGFLFYRAPKTSELQTSREDLDNFVRYYFGFSHDPITVKSYMDSNIIYCRTNSAGRVMEYRAVSMPARMAMLSSLCYKMVREDIDLSNTIEANRYLRLRAVCAFMAHMGSSNWRTDSILQGWHPRQPKKQIMLLMPKNKARMLFDLKETGSSRNHEHSVLYVPEKLNFRTWDAVHHQPEIVAPGVAYSPQRITFMQFTCLTPDEQVADGSIAESLFELVPNIVRDITGVSLTSCCVDPRSNKIVYKTVDSSPRLDIRFVMCTFHSKQHLLSDPKFLNHEKLPRNLVIVSTSDSDILKKPHF